MNWIIQQHLDELATIVAGNHFSQFNKAECHLDALRISRSAALLAADQAIANLEEMELVVASTIVISELADEKAVERVVSLLAHDRDEVRQACRQGLRLARLGIHYQGVASNLTSSNDEVAASTIDIIAFHREAANFDFPQLLSDKRIYVQQCYLEAAGRICGVLTSNNFQKSLNSNSPRVREAAYRAACRTGLSQLAAACKSKASEGECVESINYFGLLSQPNDWQLLQKLLKEPATTVAAMSAIGKSGWVKLVPWLFDFLDSEEYCEHAALAFERITGLTVPRGEPREPPEDLDEDEKDFWVTTGLPETKIIRDWWQENSEIFDQNQRYQEGHCVSQNPLPVIANQLSTLVALDVYLRERALNHSKTPDWELETWPKYWQTPGWAFSQGK